MIINKKIIVVLPAYNASKTLLETYSEIPFDIVDDVILVDDNSTDETIRVAKEIGVKNISNMKTIWVMEEIKKPVITKL